MDKKTIMVILDGFDYDFIKENKTNLKFFDNLMNEGKLNPLESVVPADSIPSWTTIYTGLNPAQHGILESIDYLDFKNKKKGDYSIIKGNSFFDELSKDGKKCLVFNPFMAYPSWDINGLMVSGPVFEGGEISTNHPDKIDIKKMPSIGGMVDQPNEKNMINFFKETMDLSQKQFDKFNELFTKENYDFAFLGITTPDRMQHFLWRFNDKTDKTYKYIKELDGSILKMYKLMEKNVKKIFEEYGGEYNIVVISDHGHGKRCEKTFYVNKWLINNGYIENKSFKKRLIEYFKNTMFKFLATFHIVEKGTKFFKKFKFAHKVKDADYVFSNKKSKVYVPKFDGTNPFGGIMVDKSYFCNEKEYNEFRDIMIDKLLKVKDNGENIMLWVKKREDIYSGEKVENYPDIVYRMKPNYGVDRGLYGKKMFGINAMHEIISGGHKFVGVIMSNRVDSKKIKSVLDIYNYIISISK